jgi:hypothetical protein
MPVPDINSIQNVAPVNMFGGPLGAPTGYPSGISPITTAGVNSLDATGDFEAVPITGSGNVPLVIPTMSQSVTPIENIDYVNCSSRYAIARTGLTGSVTAIANVNGNPKKCQFKIGGVPKEYSFISQTGIVGVSAALVLQPGSGTLGGPSVLPADGPAIAIPTFTSLTVTTPVTCQLTGTPTPAQITAVSTERALTGFGSSIQYGQIVTNDTCEYKITSDNTLPFARTFQTVSFYSEPSGLRLKSISNSNPVGSTFAYFKSVNVKPTFIDDYMALLQFMRYTWNRQFYIKEPTNTRYWKMGRISRIGILANDDAIVFEAESSLYGSAGSLDVQSYMATRYFKITPRINTSSGTDPNNYTSSPYPISNISIYKSEDSATSFGPYRVSAVPTLPPTSADQYSKICTYNGINHNTAWYDLNGTGTAPTTAPPSTYVVMAVDTPLTYGYYNMVRFTVTSSASPDRAEITRFMFYDTEIGTGGTTIYKYIPIRNANVEIEGILSNYPLVEKGKPTCDPGFVEVIDPRTGIALCIYNGTGTSQYTQATPCNSGDTTISGPVGPSGGQYVCLRPLTYTKAADFACGIGYFGAVSGTVCNLIGDFNDVIDDPSFLFNTNQAIPRLRIPLNKKVTIRFNKMVHISGFSFITGSSGTLPLKWTLEGSVNGINWRTIHCQNTIYNYSNANPRVNSSQEGITSFFTPGIFLINQTGSSGNSCAPSSTTYVPQATTGPVTTAGYSQNNLQAYNNTATNIAEGFQSTVPDSKRIQIFKFKILETYDPTSKFVHMSQLDFLTRSGRVPKSAIKLSNLQGSRKSPKEGVGALLEGPQRRWVDYNKSDITIQITGVSEPIIGFRFSIPQDVLSPMGAMPIEWVMYGSYDRQSWVTLHEFSGVQLPLVNSFATIVFKFNSPVIV